jgi:N-acetylmuramate 1-kinase
MTSTMEEKLSPRVIELAAGHLRQPAGEIVITRLTGDASTRAYFRAQAGRSSIIISIYEEPFDETEKASSRLRAREADNPAARLTFASDPCAHIEVTELFRSARLPVPLVLAASGRDRVLLIEDVGDVKLQEWLVGRSADEATSAYRRALELIVRLQEATPLALDSNCICSRLAFDEAKLKWELGFFFANYFNRYKGVRLDAPTSKGVQEDFRQLCAELAARPRVLTHRDYHARNLMMCEDKLFIIDHQDARMGPASYDVASLLSDPYTSLDAGVSSELVDYFIEMKAASSSPLSDAGEFLRELEMMRVQRMLKAIGTYSYQAAVMNNTAYVAYIKPAIERATASMKALGRFDTTRALLDESCSQVSGSPRLT